MFSTFTMDKHSTLASKEYVKVFNVIFDIIQREFPMETAYLRKLNLKDLKIYECSSMTIENGIMGAWLFLKPDNLYLQKWVDPCTNGLTEEELSDFEPYHVYYKGNDITTYHEALFALANSALIWVTILHELAHKYQYTCSPILYLINRLVTLFVDKVPLLQEVGIEYDARKRSEVPELIEFVNGVFNVFVVVFNGQTARALQSDSDEKKNRVSSFNKEQYQKILRGESNDEYPPDKVKIAIEIFDRVFNQD